MPQPALPLNKYLSAQLPAVRENFPAGGGATGERKQYDGVLTGVSIVDDFKSLVSSCECRQDRHLGFWELSLAISFVV